MNYENVLKFWFDDIDQSQWWVKDDDFDQRVRDQFSDIHAIANKCELYKWRTSARGRLAEIIILDQFSRNMYRGQPQSFDSDSLALALSQEAIALGADIKLSSAERCFIYMPFMHSESKLIHNIAITLFDTDDLKTNLDFELKHKRIIDQFGRYPHRNEILGRESSVAELIFLSQPNSSF